MNPKNALSILLEFKPSAPVGNNSRTENFLTRLIPCRRVVRAGGTDKLRNDNTLGAVDYERTAFRHKREFSHKYGLVDNFVLNFIYEPDFNVHRKRVSRVAVTALLFVVLGFFIEPVFEEIQLVVIRVVGYRHEVFENFGYTLFHKRVIA